MFKFTFSIIYLVLFIVFQNNIYNVSSFPTGAGSCDNVGILSGHGTAQQNNVGGYSITAVSGTGGSYDVSVASAKGSPKGVLVYTTGAGAFSVVDTANFQVKADCGGGVNAVTHLNPSQKTTPMKFKWTPTDKTGSVTFKGVVVDRKATWYTLQDVTVNLATGDSTAPTGNTTNTNTPPSSTLPTVDNGFGAWIKNYKLFVIMIGITTVLYVIGSIVELMLKKQNSKARSFAKTVGGFGIAK